MSSLHGFVRILGICTAVAILFSACGDTPSNSVTDVDASASPTSTSGAEEERATDARAEDVPATPTDSVDSQRQADFFVPFARLGPDPKWQEVFDLLTPSEQSCIREEFDDETLEYVMDSLVYGLFDDLAPRPWAVPLISCLLPDTNRAVFLHRIVGDLDRLLHHEMGITTSIDQVLCIRDRIDDLGMASVLTAFAKDDSGVAQEIANAVLACVPEFFYVAFAQQTGMESRELSEEQRTCIQEWVDGLDEEDKAILFSPEDIPAATADVGIKIFVCVPDLFLAGYAEELGMELPAIGEDESACVQRWIDGLDEEDMTILLSFEDNPGAAADLSMGVMVCVPELFLAGFAEGLGVDFGEMAEDQISCLTDWLEGLDQNELAIFIFPEDDPQAALELGFEMTDCIPDLLPPRPPEVRVEEPI